MKKQMNLLKLTGIAGLMAVVSVGCASGDASRAHVTGADSITVSALSLSPETRPEVLNKWPIEWNLRSIDTYTFVVPEAHAGSPAMAGSSVRAGARTDAPNFSADLPEGSVFVEAAGAESQATSGRRVIRHSPFSR